MAAISDINSFRVPDSAFPHLVQDRPRQARIWTIANQKGGVGKTTSVVSLGGLLARQGKRVLMMDLDPQGSLSVYFKLDPDKLDSSVFDLFMQDEPIQTQDVLCHIQETDFERLYLLPASSAMATLDRRLGGASGKGLVVDRIGKQLAHLFDYILIDCSPSLGILLVNALAACHRLIIPVQTEFLALKGLERMMNTLTMIMKSTRRELPHTILPTMFDRRTRASLLALEQLRADYGDKVWSDVIPVNTDFREASRSGVPLPLKSPGGRGSLAYQHLLGQLLADEEERATAPAVTGGN